jgi:hypothetical protein
MKQRKLNTRKFFESIQSILFVFLLKGSCVSALWQAVLCVRLLCAAHGGIFK